MEFDYKRLKAERIAKGYTVQDMANKLGVAKSTYSKKENGKIPLTIEDFTTITSILDIPKESMSIFFTINVDNMETKGKEVVEIWNR